MTSLSLALVGDYRRPEVHECYRTGVVGRWVCLDRHPFQWRKWCAGCARMARLASQITDACSANVGEKRSGPGAASTAPDLPNASEVR